MFAGKVSGEKNLYSNMSKYVKLMDVGVQDAMEKVVELIVAKARALAPVDTGKLRTSIEGVVRKMFQDTVEGHVEAAVHYATLIELGTSKMQAQPFMMPAIEEGLKIMTRELQQAHKRAAGRLK